MKEALLVFIGGGAGSVLRYLLGILLSGTPADRFPVGTFTVNISGCLLIGIITGLLSGSPHHFARFLLITGFCGGFTTFSTFSSELLALLRTGDCRNFMLYASLSLILGIAAAAAGFRISSLLR